MQRIAFFTVLASLPVAACDKAPDASPSTEEQANKAALTKPAEEAAPQAKADAEGVADSHTEFSEVSPDEVEKLLGAKGCVPVDANGASTRSEYGVLPDAVLLSGSDFDLAELPEDKNGALVFYCGGPACSAAPKAAKRALEAGYADVRVMREGIRGWVEAGKPVDKA